MKRSKLAGMTAAFLVLMILFTVLSRAADSAGIANVTLGRPQNMMITHEVRGSGRVEQNQEYAVVTEAGQRVKTVYVNEGQQVEEGDLLFELDLDSLKESILKQKQEIQKLELQLQDAASQEEAGELRRANDQAQAAENYSLSASRASVSLSHAKENLEKAKKELKDYREKEGISTEDTLAEQELEQICQERSEAYIQAQQDLQTLQWRIEKAVDDALLQARQESVTGGAPEQILSGIAAGTAQEVVSEQEYSGVETRTALGDGSEQILPGGAPDSALDRDVSGIAAECVPNTQIKTRSAGTEDVLEEENLIRDGEAESVTVGESQSDRAERMILVGEEEPVMAENMEENELFAGENLQKADTGAEIFPEADPAADVPDPTDQSGLTELSGSGEQSGINEENTDIQIDSIIEEAEPYNGTAQDSTDQGSGPAENGYAGNDQGNANTGQTEGMMGNGSGAEGNSAYPEDGTASETGGAEDRVLMGTGDLKDDVLESGAGWDSSSGMDDVSGSKNDLPGSQTAEHSLTQQELDKIEQEVRSQYAVELETAQQAVDDTLEEKQKAEAALEDCRQKMLAAHGSQSAEQEQQLIDAVKAAQMSYEDAAIAANEAAVTGKRQVAAAGLPEAQSSTADIYQLDLKQMKQALSRLRKLKKTDGRIQAPVDGIVTGIHVTAGERTPDGTSVMLADLTKGCRLTVEIPLEQEKYISRGDLAEVRSGDGKTTLKEISVEAVTVKAEDESVCLVTVQIPENKLQIGTTAELSLTKKSAAYPLCIPLAALYLDEKNQPYVLAVQEVNSILGTEMQAFKVAVTVEERNDSYAALAQGGISSSQSIIVSSDRAVSEGSRVRTTG